MINVRGGGLLAALAIATSLLSGCGGGAGPDSGFQGAYRGSYSVPGRSETGNLSFSVEQRGKMTGSFVDGTSGAVGALNGKVDNNGGFSGSVEYPTGPRGVSGLLAKTAGGIAADFRMTVDGTAFDASFDVNAGEPLVIPGDSLYQGAYQGSFNIPGLDLSGATSYSVDQKGRITGSFVRINETTKRSETALFLGSVGNGGSFSGSVAFPTATYALTGTLVKSADNSASGNFVVDGRQAGSFAAPVAPPAGSTGNSLVGSYRGTYGMPERSESGSVSFTVDPKGEMRGFFSQTANTLVGTFEGSVLSEGSFTGSITYDNGQLRSITGKLATSAVNGKLAGDYVQTINGRNIPGNFEVSIGAAELDSVYQGSYGASNIVPGYSLTNGSGGALANFGGADFTVDKQGDLIGTFGSSVIKARITNDGRIAGTMGGYLMNGKLSRQGIPYEDKPAVPAVGTTPGTPAVIVFRPGVAGNFTITINGTDYPGTFAAIGGLNKN